MEDNYRSDLNEVFVFFEGRVVQKQLHSSLAMACCFETAADMACCRHRHRRRRRGKQEEERGEIHGRGRNSTLSACRSHFQRVTLLQEADGSLWRKLGNETLFKFLTLCSFTCFFNL